MTDLKRVEVTTVPDRPQRHLRPATEPASPADPSGQPTAVTTGAFDDLYRTEWSAIVALGWTLTGSWVQAEELAQDAFTDTYRRWADVARFDRPGAWVRRAVINRAASYHRHRAVENRGLERWSSMDRGGAGEGTDLTGDTATDRTGDPAFWAAMRSLPERQLACLALHYLEDLSVAAIANIVGCRESTVKVHLHRGRRTLADQLSAQATTRTGRDAEKGAPR
jgi:RNA polymerase sigma factor (sigma-70 family)